jgi:hypothetical protein
MWLEQDIAAGNGSVLEFHRKNYGENFEYPGNRGDLKNSIDVPDLRA